MSETMSPAPDVTAEVATPEQAIAVSATTPASASPERRRIPSMHEVINGIVARAVPKPKRPEGTTPRKEYLYQQDRTRLVIKLQKAVGERNASAPPTVAIIENMQAILRGDGSFLMQFPFTTYPEAQIQATQAYLESLKEGLEPGIREPSFGENIQSQYNAMKTGVATRVAASVGWARTTMAGLIAKIPGRKGAPAPEIVEADAE